MPRSSTLSSMARCNGHLLSSLLIVLVTLSYCMVNSEKYTDKRTATNEVEGGMLAHNQDLRDDIFGIEAPQKSPVIIDGTGKEEGSPSKYLRIKRETDEGTGEQSAAEPDSAEGAGEGEGPDPAEGAGGGEGPETTAPAPPTPDTNTNETLPEPEASTNTTEEVNLISQVDRKNYTFVLHTPFDKTGLNGWDFEGIWFKVDLATISDEGKRPIPLPRPPKPSARVEGGGDAGSAAGGGAGGEQTPGDDGPNNATNPPPIRDDDNFVFINYASAIGNGLLTRNFPPLSNGEIVISYFIKAASTTFTASVLSPGKEKHELLKETEITKKWTIKSVALKDSHTTSGNFTVVLEATSTAEDGKTIPLMALNHIAVAGISTEAVVPPAPGPAGNTTVTNPGSLEEMQKISSAIWTALYVFLAFFLLLIVALVLVVARGRCR